MSDRIWTRVMGCMRYLDRRFRRPRRRWAQMTSARRLPSCCWGIEPIALARRIDDGTKFIAAPKRDLESGRSRLNVHHIRATKTKMERLNAKDYNLRRIGRHGCDC